MKITPYQDALQEPGISQGVSGRRRQTLYSAAKTDFA